MMSDAVSFISTRMVMGKTSSYLSHGTKALKFNDEREKVLLLVVAVAEADLV